MMSRVAHYRIVVKGQLSPEWSDWFDGLALMSQAGGETVLQGPVADQAALYGLLGKAQKLGLELLSLQRVKDAGTGEPECQHPTESSTRKDTP